MISSMISVHVSICPGSFSLEFQLQHTFKSYDPNRTSSDTGGVAEEQEVCTTGLAESEFSTRAQCIVEPTRSMRTSNLAPENS